LLYLLKKEGSQILKWFVEGCLKYQKHGLKTPYEIIEAVKEYRSEMDIIGDFIEQCCELGESGEYRITINDLHKKYSDWCIENDEEPLLKKSFGKKLKGLQIEDCRINESGKISRGFRGIRLKKELF
jgi:putative DNA primase/helicase